MTMAESSSNTRSSPASWRSSKLAFASRVLLGLILLSGGINNLLMTERWNPNATSEGDRVLSLLQETGYLLHAVAITEITVGILFLSGYFLSLSLVVSAPLLVNFFLFHIFVQFAGIEGALMTGAFYAYLVYVHRHHFSEVLSP